MKRCPNPDCPDIKLFGVVGEYNDSVYSCPKCDALLENVQDGAEVGAEQGNAVAQPVAYRLAVKLSNAAVVPVAKSLLDSAGILYFVKNEIEQDLVGYGRIGTGFNIAIGEVEFWVDEESLEEAVQVLRELDNQERPQTSSA
jgi:hypothetical protein